MPKATAFILPLCSGAALASALCLPLSAHAQAQPASRAVPTVQVPAPADTPLTDRELAMAAKVYVGAKSCELGQSVQIDPISDAPGHFQLRMGGQSYRMRPVETTTGAVRLEDRHQGAVWIQLSNKSMLMSQRLGRRLADECANAVQKAAADAMKLNPAPLLLDVAQTPSR
jgi:hypothetical protein